MADFVVNTVAALFNAEEGTTLATVATVIKYCIFMAIPFIGWSLVEVFFLVLSNPIVFAGLWILITVVGLVADYLNNYNRINGESNFRRGIPPLLDFRQAANIAIDSNNNDETENYVNNNFHQVEIRQATSEEAVATVPDIGTQTPGISEPVTPCEPSGISTPRSPPLTDSELPPAVAETQTPTLNIEVNNQAENTDLSLKQSMSPLVKRITNLAKQLAEEKDVKRSAKDDATWILHPPNNGPSTAPADILGTNR